MYHMYSLNYFQQHKKAAHLVPVCERMDFQVCWKSISCTSYKPVLLQLKSHNISLLLCFLTHISRVLYKCINYAHVVYIPLELYKGYNYICIYRLTMKKETKMRRWRKRTYNFGIQLNIDTCFAMKLLKYMGNEKHLEVHNPRAYIMLYYTTLYIKTG